MSTNLLNQFDAILTLDAREIDSATHFDSVLTEIKECCTRAFLDGYESSEFLGQAMLNRIYSLHFTIRQPGTPSAEGSCVIEAIRNLIEAAFLEREERALPESFTDDVPTHHQEYKKWLINYIHEHPAHSHPVYDEFLPKYATPEDIRYYMIQESCSDFATDDYLAMMQTGSKGGVKMEIASNYWDEMGNGNPADLHSQLFANTLDSLGISSSELNLSLETEALACGNLQLLVALRRKHFYKAVGYFATVEYMVPRRFANVMKGWTRNQLGNSGRLYHEAHITIDANHSEHWFENVVVPLVRDEPAAAVEIARGAAYRLNTSKRYLDRIFKNFPSLNARPSASRVASSTV